MKTQKQISSYFLFSILVASMAASVAQSREHDLTSTADTDGVRVYVGPVGVGIPTAGNPSGQSSTILGGDVLGLLQPINSQLLLGGMLKHTYDSVSINVPSGTVSLNKVESHITELGPTAMFFSHDIGEGFIGRVDASLVSVGYTEGYSGRVAGLPGQSATADSWSGRSSLGFGFALGTGYAMSISGSSSLLVNFGWSYRTAKIEGRSLNYRTLALSLGVLF